MSKFTGGKWEVVVIYGDHYAVFSNDEIVADYFGSNANAHLIAAAPEMYKLLKAFAECRHEDGMFGLMEDAQELIARIDGEEDAEDE